MKKLIKSSGWAFSFNKEDENEMLKILTTLSEKYLNGKVFLPHISCFGSTVSTEAENVEIIKKIKKIKPFKIKLHQILFEKKIFKTLFIEVEPNQEMLKVVKLFEKSFGQAFAFNPHISLIYKEDLSIAERKKLAASLKFPKTIEVSAIIRYTNDTGEVNFDKWETVRYPFCHVSSYD